MMRKQVIGRTTKIDFPDSKVFQVPAKIDTGAWSSSVWASDIREEESKLHFKLLGPSSPLYSGVEIAMPDFKIVEVENSFGHKEGRYSVMIRIKLGNRMVSTRVTLSDREYKSYPILIGRRFLQGRFIVDVELGDQQHDESWENVK